MRTTADITLKQSEKAIDTLSEALPGLSRQKIKDAMAKGACWWTHKGKRLRLRRATKELKPGIRLQLYYDEKVLARTPENPVLLEDLERYTVWFKPHGLLAQGSQWGDHCSLLRLADNILYAVTEEIPEAEWNEVVNKALERFMEKVPTLDQEAAKKIVVAVARQSDRESNGPLTFSVSESS